MAKIKKKILKAKKKFWFQIVSPRLFSERVIGEGYVSEPSLLMGRRVHVNLRTLTDDISKQNIRIGFVVEEVKDNKAYCRTISYELFPAAVKRLVSRGKVRVEDFFVGKTTDNISIRLKLVLVTTGLANKSVITRMRKELRNGLEKRLSELTYENLLQELIAHNLQLSLKKELRKVYPLRACEVIKLVIKSGKIVVEENPKEEIEGSKEEEEFKESHVEKKKEKKAKPIKEEKKVKKTETTEKEEKEEKKETKVSMESNKSEKPKNKK